LNPEKADQVIRSGFIGRINEVKIPFCHGFSLSTPDTSWKVKTSERVENPGEFHPGKTGAAF
jgi:hypothetical protein